MMGIAQYSFQSARNLYQSFWATEGEDDVAEEATAATWVAFSLGVAARAAASVLRALALKLDGKAPASRTALLEARSADKRADRALHPAES
eukprot:scaffold1726_cov260-Pinguiococcus_pyrenoidosus.AAC.16